MTPRLTPVVRVRFQAALLALALAVGIGLRLAAAEPANPRTNPRARKVLDYLHELSRRTDGRRILSGQFSDFGNGANLRIMERIHEQTGQWPAVLGVDYADFARGSLTTVLTTRS
jgi:mannan endo-1,4-beta-mannosidase